MKRWGSDPVGIAKCKEVEERRGDYDDDVRWWIVRLALIMMNTALMITLTEKNEHTSDIKWARKDIALKKPFDDSFVIRILSQLHYILLPLNRTTHQKVVKPLGKSVKSFGFKDGTIAEPRKLDTREDMRKIARRRSNKDNSTRLIHRLRRSTQSQI